MTGSVVLSRRSVRPFEAQYPANRVSKHNLLDAGDECLPVSASVQWRTRPGVGESAARTVRFASTSW